MLRNKSPRPRVRKSSYPAAESENNSSISSDTYKTNIYNMYYNKMALRTRENTNTPLTENKNKDDTHLSITMGFQGLLSRFGAAERHFDLIMSDGREVQKLCNRCIHENA